MYYIVGDIGNTSTRICLLDKKSKILKSVIFDTKNIFLKGFTKKKLLKNFLKDLKRSIIFMRCSFSFKKIKKVLKKDSFDVLEVKSLNLKKLIKLNIKNMKQLGSDRIVNSIAGKNFIIV